MIVSYSRRYIFLKPFKVAGTSILQALGATCRDADLVSAVFLEPEQLQNFSTSKLIPIPHHVDANRPRATRYRVNTTLNTHALPRIVRKTVGNDVWDSAFKFTAVRNPWDLMVSFQRMQLLNPIGYQEPPMENFASFAADFRFDKVPPPFNEGPVNDCWYFDSANGKPLVDFFIRFERLQADFDAVCERLQIPRQTLPHMQDKGPRLHYSSFYDKKTRDLVASLFARTIDHFNYTFEICGPSVS